MIVGHACSEHLIQLHRGSKMCVCKSLKGCIAMVKKEKKKKRVLVLLMLP